MSAADDVLAAGARDANGYGSSSAWLAARAGMAKKDAKAAVRQMRQLTGRPRWRRRWPRHLRTIHQRIFGDIYDWAGQLRTVAIAKGSRFCLPQYIESSAAEIFRALHGEGLLRGLPRDVFIASKRVLGPDCHPQGETAAGAA